MTQEKLLTTIYIWKGKLQAQTPFHIGKGEEGENTDAIVMRDWKSRPYIPASSLAGVFRSCFRMMGVPKNIIDILCGSCNQRSLLRYEDAYPIQDAATEIRDGVSINRERKVAQDKAKFDLETVAKGTCFQFSLQLHLEDWSGDQDVSVEELIGHVNKAIDAWCKDFCHIGKGASRGLGWFHLEISQREKVDLAQPEELCGWLLERKGVVWNDQKEMGNPSLLKLSFVLTVEEPIVIKDSRYSFRENLPIHGLNLQSNHSGFLSDIPDYQPLLTRLHDGKYHYLLTGSSIKGPLRLQAECILKDILGEDKVCDLTQSDNCSARLKAQKERNYTSRKEWEKRVCPACAMFGNTYLKSRIIITDAIGKNIATKRLDHVALDEFTQEPMEEGAKFDGEVIYTGEFETTWMACFFGSKASNGFLPWQNIILYLLLRDIQKGRIRFGFGKCKGFGKLTIKEETISQFLSNAGIKIEEMKKVMEEFQKNVRPWKEILPACIEKGQ